MGLDRLDTPLRVTWDLHGPGFETPAFMVAAILRRLDEAEVFFVHLETTPLAHRESGSVLRHLADRGRQVSLLCDGSKAELDNLSVLDDLPASILLRVEPFIVSGRVDFRRLLSVVRILQQAGLDPGLSLTPDRENLSALAALLDFCREHGIKRLKLPNVRIDDNFQHAGKDRIPTAKDVEKLREELPDTNRLTDGVALEIHDLFLWEILSPGGQQARSEYDGCQAANSLAHISADGSVMPCMTWPEPLGSLAERSFSEIWTSERCDSIRHQIAVQPPGCAGCRDYHSCFGGCRGLSRFLDSDNGLDPACSGPRK